MASAREGLASLAANGEPVERSLWGGGDGWPGDRGGKSQCLRASGTSQLVSLSPDGNLEEDQAGGTEESSVSGFQSSFLVFNSQDYNNDLLAN
jgi:hypothetical protein